MLHLGSPEETHRPFTSEVNSPFRLLFEDSWGVGWGFFVVFVCLGNIFLLVGLFGLGFFLCPVGNLQGNLMVSLEACVCGSCACVLNLCMRVCMGERASD